ncbi:unnamed protein product [Staurois parvus]|uniref:Uncharacterized protein n=1 Tax=Staurois parvus TaxID=386267 RepID=A0ABN9EFY2_9NEOB|nr:unnamed protein product [Staurois parvus]
MSPLQHPQPSPPADAGISLLGSSPCERQDIWDVWRIEPAGNSKTLNKI